MAVALISFYVHTILSHNPHRSPDWGPVEPVVVLEDRPYSPGGLLSVVMGASPGRGGA